MRKKRNARHYLTRAMWLLEIGKEIADSTVTYDQVDELLGVSVADVMSAALDCIQSAWTHCEGWPEKEVSARTNETIAVIHMKDAILQAKDSLVDDLH